MSHHTRGRKAAPTALADAITKAPSPPTGMSPEARKEWRRVVPILVERRALSAADIGAVERYVEAVGDLAAARARIAADGAYVPNARGELKRHPAFATVREAAGEARRWAAELGITPASRNRVATEGGDNDDAASDLGLG